MSRIYKGMVVRTSYGTGPYVVKDFTSGCTCPSFVDSINMSNPPASRSHYHIVCQKEGERSNSFLNGYDENLNSVWSNERLIVCAEETLFLTMCLGL